MKTMHSDHFPAPIQVNQAATFSGPFSFFLFDSVWKHSLINGYTSAVQASSTHRRCFSTDRVRSLPMSFVVFITCQIRSSFEASGQNQKIIDSHDDYGTWSFLSMLSIYIFEYSRKGYRAQFENRGKCINFSPGMNHLRHLR